MSSYSTVPAAKVENDYSNRTRNDFPDDFIFGTATSAYQVEGGATKGGRGISIWDNFTLRTPGRIDDGSNGNVAVDMYTKYEDDIRMMKSMGFDAFRMSISWPRILPGGRISLGVCKEGIDFYNAVINTVIANGMKPFVTLFHWDLPQHLQEEYDGFLSNKVVDDFKEFAELCFWEFGDRVKYWITLNEPWTYAHHGYVSRTFPPSTVATSRVGNKSALKAMPAYGASSQKKGTNFVSYRGSSKVEDYLDAYSLANEDDIAYQTMNMSLDTEFKNVDYQTMTKSSPKYTQYWCRNRAREAYTVARNLILAHAAAVDSYRTKFQKNQQGIIGATLVTHWFEPLTYTPKDKKAAKRALDFMLGWFLQPMLTGKYPQNMVDYVPGGNLQPFSADEIKLLTNSLDFLGLNYYTSYYAQDDPNPSGLSGYDKDQQVLFTPERDGELIGQPTDADWLYIVPWGIKSLLKSIDTTYTGIPAIYITENGMAEKNDHTLTAKEASHDTIRANYYRDHLGNILDAMNDNKDTLKKMVKGYFAWSWCDNFEWKEGYTLRFGIIYIDYMNYLTRYPKFSATWFNNFLAKKNNDSASSC